MRKKFATGLALLVAVSFVALTVVRAGRAQGAATGKARMLEPLAPSLSYEIIRVGWVTVAPNQQYFQLVTCPAGKKVVGGGFSSGSYWANFVSSSPVSPTTWEVKAYNESKDATASFSAYAVCIVAN